jgi:hypothetical protein
MDGMPVQMMVFDTVVARLRLGDLVAVYHPASQKHQERSERFVGLSRVTGLRRAPQRGFAWVDLETVHRFKPALDLGEAPGRVFLCCDPGWPERDVALFRRVFAAAVDTGWQPAREDREAAPPAVQSAPAAEETEVPAPAPRPSARPLAAPTGRLFGGVDYSGDMRDPKERTWLALAELHDDRLRLFRLEATGRSGLEAVLRDPDAALLRAEAIGLDFPFGLPVPFAEALLGGPFPEEGWWSLARHFERLTRAKYLIALQEFRDSQGEIKRLTDERCGAFSPLHRVDPDLGPMTYHGIRMIAEDRSRYAIRPFETARGRLLLEVYPGAIVRRLTGLPEDAENGRLGAVVKALGESARLPVEMDAAQQHRCLSSRDALDAVIAARCAAVAVLSGEVDRTPENLAPGEGERVRREGWIYGIDDPTF